MPPSPAPWTQSELRETDGALVLLATYSVGKERLLVALARAHRLLICVPPKRLTGLALLGLAPDDLRYFTADPALACVHVVGMDAFGSSWPYFVPDFAKMEEKMAQLNALASAGAAGAAAEAEVAGAAAEAEAVGAASPQRFTRVVGILPSGWSYRGAGGSPLVGGAGGCASIHLIPYSEHSSSSELDQFVGFLKPTRVVPSVYRDQAEYERMEKRFHRLTSQTAAKQLFLRKNWGSAASAAAGASPSAKSGAAPHPPPSAGSSAAAAGPASVAAAVEVVDDDNNGDDVVEVVGGRLAGKKRRSGTLDAFLLRR